MLRPAVVAALVAALVGCAPGKNGTGERPPPDPTPRQPITADWKEVDRLIEEQKLEEASKKVAEIRAAAQEAGDEATWTRSLIREVQLRTGLHGYETAVRFLREQPWPKAPTSRVALELFYGQSLVHYLRAYSWEIRQRERVEQKGPVDLKRWTADQIHAEAERAYGRVWKDREALGKQPVGVLSEYVRPNTYPENVRGTLRDAVTYLFVELLADTSGWRPEQSNELWRLDWKALLEGGAAAVDPADPAIHPLVRIGAVLDDLEAWHQKSGRPEAALEARLERLRRLAASYTEAEARQAMREHLERRLKAARQHPWWAMGMAELAEAWRREGDLVRARAVADEGQKAFPGSTGGQRCRSIVESIDLPAFDLAGMLTDGARRRSVLVTHKNLPRLHFRAYAVDLDRRITQAQDYALLPDTNDTRKLVEKEQPVATWTVDLPPTPDHQSHRTYVVPPLDRPGLYVIAASTLPGFEPQRGRVMATNLIVGDLVLVSRTDGSGDLDVTVVSGRTGRPVAGADVALWRFDWGQGRRHARVEGKKSDDKGQVRFSSRGREHRPYFVYARHGEHATVDANHLYLNRAAEPGESLSTLIYTDRSIYRPLQKLYFKVIPYRGRADRAAWKTLPDQPLEVILRDPNHQEVARVSVKTNSFGSAAGELAIPAGRLLGHWTLHSSLGGQTAVRVEEYKRPTFEVTLEDLEGAPRLNKPVTIPGQARYYFGLPVTQGALKWRVTREPVYPWWWWYRYGASPASGAQVVAQGGAQLDAQGKFKITFTPEADEKRARGAKDVTYRYAVSADLTDEGGETRSAERSFRVGFVSVEAHVTSEVGFVRPGAPVALEIRRASLDGAARPGKGQYRLVALEQPRETVPPADLPAATPAEGGPETPGDRLRPRWEHGYNPDAVIAGWKDGAERAGGAVEHGADGKARVQLPALAPGAYRLRYTTRDEHGAAFETWKDLVVAGKRTPLAVPAAMYLERASVKVGETARLLVASGLEDQTLFLDIFKNGVHAERRRLAAPGALVELPVGERDRGGFGVSLVAVRDHQLVQLSHSVFVPWDDRELKVEFQTFRDRLRPGAKETFRVLVKGASGKAVDGAAEVLAYMYDRSLDLFGPHSPPSPLSLYPFRGSVPWPRATLGRAYPHWVWAEHQGVHGWSAPQGDHLLFFDGYGIGGLGRGRYRARDGRLAEGVMAQAPAAMPAPAAPPPPPAEAEAAPGRAEKRMAKLEAVSGAKEARADAAGGEGKKAPEVRSNFAETAFFAPQLLAARDGTVTIEFTVPDSVTSWNVWAHAVTRDLRGGSAQKETRSVKDLMVRPYLPRFFREGDQAELRVVVNYAPQAPRAAHGAPGAAARALEGTVELDIIDPQTQKSVRADFGLQETRRPFKAAPDAGTTLTYAVKAPSRPGQVAFRVLARAGDLSDGELRPLPVLPGRMHLAQSRFVILKDKVTKTLRFEDLAKADDPSRINDQLVVTLDAQLFYGVLKALPYLLDYPYECTEQTLNRFLSAGIVSAVFKDFPAVAKMAAELARRPTRLETWDAVDPNRRMALEETPWLQEARGGADPGLPLVRVLDPRVARAERDASLDKLKKAQTGIGAFPWFPGGPPSPYMTLYLLHGFARAAEFGVEVPRDMVQRAWSYIARHYREEWRRYLKDDCCWETLTFLNYVAGAYPDASWTGGGLSPDERRELLDFSFRHWKKHSPYLKSYLALTLKRMNRDKDARLVWASVMDSAKTTEDQGTFWAPEDRAWLWYNDTIETHAFALRTLMEIDPKSPKLDGLVTWLFLNKKLNHWKSTKATAEVIYALVHYLKKQGTLAIREEATVKVGPEQKTFTFEPEQYAGKVQVVLPGEKVDARAATITVEKPTRGTMFASATWHFSTEKLPSEARGDFFQVTRKYYRRALEGKQYVLRPLAEGAALAVGDELEVHLSLRAKHAAEYVHLRDPRGAGFEPENAVSRHKWDLGISWYEEVRDSGTNFFFESLPVGEYTFKYRVRAATAGTFRVSPATLQCMYAPEFNAYSEGHLVSIKPR